MFVDNDISAYSGKPRPQYRRMLERLPEVGHVLVWHTERLHRRPKELEEYAELAEEHGVLTDSVQGGPVDLSTPQGRLNARIYASIASYESEHKAARSRRKAEQTVLGGRSVNGQRPFGFNVETTEEDRAQKRGGRFVVNEREAGALRTAIDEILGGRPMNSIRVEWNREDRPGGALLTTRGTPWDASNLQRMLVRPRNAGFIVWEGEEIDSEGAIPAILSYDRWRRLRGKLAQGKRPGDGHAFKAKTLGSGIIQCRSGTRVKRWKAPIQRSGSDTTNTYRCVDGTKRGVHPTKRVQFVDACLHLAVWQWFGNPLEFQLGVLTAEESERAKEIDKERDDLNHRLNEITEALAEPGGIPLDSLRRAASTISERRTALDAEAENLRSKVSVSQSPFIQAVERGQDQERRYREWCELDLESKRDMLRSTFRIMLHPTPKSAPRIFDPNTVEIRVLGPAGDLPDELPPEVDPHDESGAAAELVPGSRVAYFPEDMAVKERARQLQAVLEELENLTAR